jgi:MFS family permease
MGLSTIALSYITTPSIALWAGVLFITRIGAAAVEIGKETYLFKNINAGDSSILSLARMTMPLSYLVGPVAATVFLLFFDFRFIFFALGLIVLFGLRYALVLVDTK